MGSGDMSHLITDMTMKKKKCQVEGTPRDRRVADDTRIPKRWPVPLKKEQVVQQETETNSFYWFDDLNLGGD
jgi:hypothetical protein